MLKKLLRPKPFLFFYISVFIVNQIINYNLVPNIMPTSSMYTFLLFLFFAYNGRTLPKKIYIFILLGLLFGMLGSLSITLIHISISNFELVLIAYSILPFCFGIGLFKIGEFSKGLSFWLFMFAFLCFALFIYFKIEPNLLEQKIPMLVCILSNYFFAFVVFLRMSTVNDLKFLSIVFGTALYVIGISIYALDWFVVDFPARYFLTTIFYASGLYLITYGVLKLKVKKEHISYTFSILPNKKDEN